MKMRSENHATLQVATTRFGGPLVFGRLLRTPEIAFPVNNFFHPKRKKGLPL
jgi:hypothetical protein